jgi:DNA-directed RNA polymerase subunit RPC12/RpoP
MGLGDLLSGVLKPKPQAGRKAECPKCKEKVTLDMERCPKCGTHISSMFRLECPQCKAQNELNAEKCAKCGYEFVQQPAARREQYRCPLCGYVADYYMMSCPSCGARFV